jgi:N-acetylneuraminic acid mutarotase
MAPAVFVGIAVAILVVLTIPASAVAITWTTMRPAPVSKTEAMRAVVNGRLYVLGGFTASPFAPSNTVQVYDPASNTWGTAPNLPRKLTHTAVAVDGTSIYLAGGYFGETASSQTFATRDVWRFDTAQSRYVALPALPQARGSGGLVVVGRSLHFYGGVDLSRADRGEHWSLDLANPAAGWTARAAMPNPRSHLGYAVLKGKIYAIGGQRGTDAALIPQATVHVYDPATNTWSAGPSLPLALSHISSSVVVVNGRLFILGGEHGDRHAVANTYVFDVGVGWKALTPLPDTRYSAVGGYLGGAFYLTGGSDDTGPIRNQTWKGVLT